MNPTLTIMRASDNTIIAQNDDWQSQTSPADMAAIKATGFQPNNPLEPACCSPCKRARIPRSCRARALAW
jgi:hypothetical protein